MIGTKNQCIVLGIANRIQLVEERSRRCSGKIVLECGPNLGRGVMASMQDDRLRLHGLDEVFHGILVTIVKVIIIVFSVTSILSSPNPIFQLLKCSRTY